MHSPASSCGVAAWWHSAHADGLRGAANSGACTRGSVTRLSPVLYGRYSREGTVPGAAVAGAMLAFTRRLPQAASACARQVHAAPALQAVGTPGYTGTVYKESEKAREVRLRSACALARVGRRRLAHPRSVNNATRCERGSPACLPAATRNLHPTPPRRHACGSPACLTRLATLASHHRPTLHRTPSSRSKTRWRCASC